MPNRILRDSALDSDRLARVSEPAEVLFYRLLMLADDFGRFDGRLSVIRARAFALRQSVTEDEVMHRLAELSTEGLICTYLVQGKDYIYIPRFGQRQRAEKSKFPDPDSQESVKGLSTVSQSTVSGQSSAPVVVVVDVVDKRSRSRETAAHAPVDKSTRSKPLRGQGNGPSCDYCDKPAVGKVNGLNHCSSHNLQALDGAKPCEHQDEQLAQPTATTAPPAPQQPQPQAAAAPEDDIPF